MNRTGRIEQFFHFTLLLFLLSVTACGAEITARIKSSDTPIPSLTPSGLVETDSFRGVIFTAEQIAANPHWPGNDDPWTPSEADVMALEEQLAGYLQEAYPNLGEKMNGYTRQYWGTVTQNGNPAVYANFFCDGPGEISDDEWQADPVMMLDGGDCYFQTLYDIQEGVFVWLAINGES